MLWQWPLLGLLGLARANGNLSGWGHRLRRWRAVLGEPHGSYPLGSWNQMKARSAIDKDDEVAGIMSCWNAEHAGLLPAGLREK